MIKEYKLMTYERIGYDTNLHINGLAQSGWEIHSISTAGVPMGSNQEGYWITTIIFERELKTDRKKSTK